MQCSAENGSSLFSLEINFLNYTCNNIGIYIAIVLVLYPLFWVFKQDLNTTVHQIHRESLSKPPEKRNICKLVGYNLLQGLAHVVVILFITSNNVGVILSSLAGHAIAIAIVYRSRRQDIKHPVRQLAAALRQNDPRLQKDIQYIQSVLS
jgi:hypothetical protein